MALESYFDFLRDRKPQLQTIASRTRGEATIDDVCQTVWLVANEIAQGRGYIVDFHDPEDQELVLSRLGRKFSRSGDRALRSAVRVVQSESEDESGGLAAAIARRLAAPVESDPLVHMVVEEGEAECRRMISQSYSEAAAYLVLLLQFRGDARALARFLRLGFASFRRFLHRSVALVLVQPSLFDGFEAIALDFEPMPRRIFLSRRIPRTDVVQESWVL